jgi:hypothetical protein
MSFQLSAISFQPTVKYFFPPTGRGPGCGKINIKDFTFTISLTLYQSEREHDGLFKADD